MASRRLEDLTVEVHEKALTVILACQNAGIDLLIYCTLRSLEEQARLYRQSRARYMIDEKISKLRQRGLGFLADIIEAVGPYSGPHVTNAGPGESWHNYAEAWDAVPLIGGKPAWDYSATESEWNIYGMCVRESGMNWAGDWINFREYPHAQLRPGGNPLKQYGPDVIREILVNNGLLKA